MSPHEPEEPTARSESSPAASSTCVTKTAGPRLPATLGAPIEAPVPRILLVAILVMMAVLAWWEVPQQWALDFLDATLGQAFSAFAIAKGLNATISVLQSSTIDLQVFQVSPGEALDPANDMIERFSWVMFAATGSLALQKLLLGISGSLIIKAFASGACMLAALGLLTGSRQSDEGMYPRQRWWQVAILRVALWGIALRFAVLSVALASGAAGQAFLDDSRDTQMAQLSVTQQQLAEVADKQVGGAHEERSWWQQFKGSMEGWVGGPITSVTQGFDAMTDKVIGLTMLFITQTVLFPLGFLWITLRLLRGLGRLQ
ncbi:MULTISPECIES: hypothetical protein [unclassified Cobetia]|uniref:hypothetical protein n=1 Tax=unclassified Cobetia TaxID=2609414 RepID=UPI002097343A|nr:MULTISPECIES: hypothetical protein [unclassified Cobetia]MCO7233735.1 hypothetical protein [Cobetia sp. Dlab-2-AX]MCO7237092.1 hypothetical protein [Cobetia sp. Dlab-2-U]